METAKLHEFQFDGDEKSFVSISGNHTINGDELLAIIKFLANLDFKSADGKRMLSNHAIDFALFFHYRLDAYKNVHVLGTNSTGSIRRCINRLWVEKHSKDRAIAFQINRLEIADRDIAPLAMTTSKMNNLERLRRSSLAPKTEPYLLSGKPSPERGTVAAVFFAEREEDRPHFTFTMVDVRSPVLHENPEVIQFDTLGDQSSRKRAREIYDFCRKAFVAPMTQPFVYKKAAVRQTDGWSCGYQVLARLQDTVKRINAWRTFDKESEMFRDERSILDDRSFIGFQDISPAQCLDIQTKLLYKATLLYLYIVHADGNTQ